MRVAMKLRCPNVTCFNVLMLHNNVIILYNITSRHIERKLQTVHTEQ